MKKIVLFLAIIAAVLTSCEDWLDVNDNPNVPTEVSTDLVLPAAQASIAVQVGGFLFNTGGFYAQYWTQAPEANQYNTVDKYDLKTDFLDNVYAELYSGALNDIEYIRTTAETNEDWGNYLVATTLRAYTFQVLVDLLDKVPYTEALKGTEVLNPVFDDGKVVYDGVVAELDAALAKVAGNETVANTDMLLGSDIGEWIGFANALKLKLFMRQSETSNKHEAEVKALIAEGKFMSQDVMFASFSDEQNKRNSWYDTEVDRLGGVNHIATKNIITFLAANSDPRLAEIFSPATGSNEFNGNVPAGKTVPGIKNEDFSFPIVTAEQPIYLFTLAELNFFIAEAELNYNSDAVKAKAAYEAGIDASFMLHGLAVDGADFYGAGKAYEFDSTKGMMQIMMQKWAALAMVNHIEAWFETKRTGYPLIATATAAEIVDDPTKYPNPGERISLYENNLGAGKWLNRFFYPDIAVSNNTNTPEQVSLEDKVWWDVN